jgi:hypothetical protein
MNVAKPIDILNGSNLNHPALREGFDTLKVIGLQNVPSKAAT